MEGEASEGRARSGSALSEASLSAECSGRRAGQPAMPCRGAKSLQIAAQGCRATVQDSRQQLQQRRHRQPDDVEVVALDPGHQRRPAALDRVAPGPLAPLPGREVPVERRGVERRGTRRASSPTPCAPSPSSHDGDAADTTSCARPDSRASVAARLRRVGRLAVDRPRRARRRCRRRAPRRRSGGCAVRRSRTARGACGERVLEPATRRPASRSPSAAPRRRSPRRRRRRRAARGSPAAAASAMRGRGGVTRLGKKIAASRAADSSESEPWTMFWPTSSAKSPRIEPVAASSGLVAPITWRAALTASWPSSTAATSGPEVMKSTSSPKNGRSLCSA